MFTFSSAQPINSAIDSSAPNCVPVLHYVLNVIRSRSSSDSNLLNNDDLEPT